MGSLQTRREAPGEFSYGIDEQAAECARLVLVPLQGVYCSNGILYVK